MNYSDVVAVKLKSGAVMTFNLISAERKAEILDGGDYERVIKRGEMLKSTAPVIEATNGKTDMLEEILESQILKQGEKQPHETLQMLDKMLIDEIDKLKASGVDPLTAHTQAINSDLGKRIGNLKRQIEQKKRLGSSIATQNLSALDVAKMDVEAKRKEIYDEYSAAVLSGNADRAAELAKLLA
ncbi:hypothetical protein O1D52_003488 [Vibrio cholerae]|nr:hypothetical protein [Vibrio cholerae]EMC8146661.1 hypothetical protein [Vibrio cholerae]